MFRYLFINILDILYNIDIKKGRVILLFFFLCIHKIVRPDFIKLLLVITSLRSKV